MNSLELHPFTQEVPPPEPVTMTLEEFLASDIEGYEYVKGELVPMSSPSWEHAKISSNVSWYLQRHVRENRLGSVVSEGGFRVGERVLKPDVAFLSTAQLPEEGRHPSPAPPTLAVEVVSPTDVLWNVLEKVQAYLNAGTQMVWIVESVMKTVTVYRPNQALEHLVCGDSLSGEDVIEGFSCEVATFFE